MEQKHKHPPLGEAPGVSRIVGSGEMADLIRLKDWSSTPLGSIGSWSESVRSSQGPNHHGTVCSIFLPFDAAGSTSPET
jgi:hypothetical protein